MLVSSYAQRAPLQATRQRFVIVNTLSGTVGVSSKRRPRAAAAALPACRASRRRARAAATAWPRALDAQSRVVEFERAFPFPHFLQVAGAFSAALRWRLRAESHRPSR